MQIFSAKICFTKETIQGDTDVNELFWQGQQDKETLLQEVVNMILQGAEDKKPFVEEIINRLVLDGYDKEELTQEIVNRVTNQGQQENIYMRIIGENIPIDFEDIKKNLPIVPSRIIKKGDKYRYAIAENDQIIYDAEIKDGEDIINSINSLLESFLPYKDYISDISQKYFLSLRLYLSSDFAEMYCLLPQEVMKKIAKLHLNLEISILSFGGVIDIYDEDDE
jgi:hypothetical protein